MEKPLTPQPDTEQDPEKLQHHSRTPSLTLKNLSRTPSLTLKNL
jgi:hypothetical protein